ncbi:cTPxI [Dimargaris cristalligena]|uniref:thioredoxin-dependent peroxiredoxin n=1 Tax=Dimargaris cristalligena TaxID=215637 RepID=A0A4P9ZQA7_9FUNG|nr:cTPxI [Dimargaris cristalligena]RKP35656.1 thioredoxin-dependent peroxide reductase mitochondrial precursor [Dimargaris cristalligena]|eukprot:RKP35656.1 thioredoxin-dependent peroxide reductase mitochondrial precursor [Dimargaris cristalligena]
MRSILNSVARVAGRVATPSTSLTRQSITQRAVWSSSQSGLLSRGFATSPAWKRSLVQSTAPAWTSQAVVDGEIKSLSLADYQGKYVVMVFYPLDFTFVCPTELVAFSDRAADFERLNTQVVGVSVDSEFAHLAWTQLPRARGGLGPMQIPLVSDITKTIARDYGVLLKGAGVALRGLFIIDPTGNVRIAHVNDLPIGRSVDETLRLVEALQFHAEHGEVCPANWTKGADTIKPTPNDSQEYFNKVNK